MREGDNGVFAVYNLRNKVNPKNLEQVVGQSHYGLVGLYKLVELQRMFFEV